MTRKINCLIIRMKFLFLFFDTLQTSANKHRYTDKLVFQQVIFLNELNFSDVIQAQIQYPLVQYHYHIA